MSEIIVETEFTPNPNSLKFNVNSTLLENGAVFLDSRKSALLKSPLASKIFEVESVEEVMIGTTFVTVTRNAETQTWAKIIAHVSEIIQKHLEAGEAIVDQEALAAETSGDGDSDIESRIKAILDERIRPAVARDGGDIIFDSYEDGVVRLHLRGACSTCPSSVATLKMGVESMLKELIPEVQEVIQA